MADIKVKIRPAPTSNPSIKVGVQGPPKILVNQGGIAPIFVSDIEDVNISNLQDGSVLIYDSATGLFTASTLLDEQDVDGGLF
jgi:hypothetical protein